jgi:hypothetical protein
VEFIIVTILGLAVIHAAYKARTLAVLAGPSMALPPTTAIPATGGVSAPSPATAAGSPTASAAYQLALQTNTPFVNVSTKVTALNARSVGLGGLPQSFLPGSVENGYQAIPSRTKQLLTAQPPSLATRTVNPVAGQKL